MNESRRRALFAGGVIAVVLVVAYLTGTGRSGGPPLSPSSTAPDGTLGLVRVLERLGADVTVTGPDRPVEDADAVLLLRDRLDDTGAGAVEAFVEGGGLLVVTDSTSPLTPPVDGPGFGFELDEARPIEPGRCTITDLADAGDLSLPTPTRYRVEAGTDRCYSRGGRAFVIDVSLGAGTIRSLGNPVPFTNRWLDRADNAVLAARALDARTGTRISIVDPNAVGAGAPRERSLWDLVETPYRAALFQLAVAFAFVVLWRARRLGRPVLEPQPVRIDGSELTAAVGRLLQGNRRPERAVTDLRDRFRRDIAGRLGTGPDAPIDQIVSVLAARTGQDRAELTDLLTAAVTTDAELVDVAARLERLRKEIVHDRART